jgi:hypothetical protein
MRAPAPLGHAEQAQKLLTETRQTAHETAVSDRRRPNDPRDFPNKTATTQNHRRRFRRLWTTLSGFESLPPSQSSTRSESATYRQRVEGHLRAGGPH